MSDKNIIDVNTLGSLAHHGIKRVVVAIGVFDGLHRGHQRLLDQLLEMSRKHDATPVALTFYPHPRTVLRPDSSPAALIPSKEKVAQLHNYGIQAVVTIPFTSAFAALEPEEFIDQSLKSDRIELCGICVGKEWRFGAKGKGDTELLHEYSRQGHFDFVAVEELMDGCDKVSSTTIRRAISGGSLEHAEDMLGHPYSLFGTVEVGRRVAGEKLSHPTANLKIGTGIIPPNGVYAGVAVHNGVSYQAAIAIGVSPTFKHDFKEERRVEVHLLDYDGDLYGEDIEVILVKYIREERTFKNAQELKKQIESDITEIKKILEQKYPTLK